MIHRSKNCLWVISEPQYSRESKAECLQAKQRSLARDKAVSPINPNTQTFPNSFLSTKAQTSSQIKSQIEAQLSLTPSAEPL